MEGIFGVNAWLMLQVVEELVSNVTVIEKLQSFQYKDKNSKDWGLNVRQRAKELTNLVLDGERIRAERSKVGNKNIIIDQTRR